MFLQLVNPPGTTGSVTTLGPLAQRSVDSLFLYTPLQLTAIVETVWRNRYNAMSSPFVPWPQWITDTILSDNAPGGAKNFILGYDFSAPPLPGAGIDQWPQPLPSGGAFLAPKDLPGLALVNGSTVAPTNWDHLIYAYLIENTRIFDIFSRALELYISGEQLESPSPAGQIFWRNTEYLLFSDGFPSMLWTPASRLRRDEIASRSTLYNWMLGIDLSHAQDIAAAHPYGKPGSSNREFIPTFEALAREVWGGIMNARNLVGANPTDPVAIATSARRIYDMMATRRLNGNLAREEFRAVAIMSWLHLAVLYDSPVVVDLKAIASSPEQRLAKIGERVGIKMHTSAKPQLDLAQPFSFLMQAIETGSFNNASGASFLYNINPGFNVAELNAEVVVDQYSLATGRDLKAPASGATRDGVSQRPAPRAAPQPRPAAAGATNGRSTNGRTVPTH